MIVCPNSTYITFLKSKTIYKDRESNFTVQKSTELLLISKIVEIQF